MLERELHKLMSVDGTRGLMFVFFREAWKKLGSMTKEEAMQEYVQELTRVEPNWEEQVNTCNAHFKNGTSW